MTKKKTSKKKQFSLSLPRFSFTWKRRGHIGESFLIYGKTVVFALCSLISAIINIVFISNLTKESYEIGTLLSIPAAVFLGILSIGLDASKTIHVIQVNSLNEMYRKLAQFEWAKSIKNTARKWNTVYLLYVALSIITSVSLSTISIGAGITRNANMLGQIDELIMEGEKYSNLESTSQDIHFKHIVSAATDSSENDAINFARQSTNNLWPAVEAYKDERSLFLDTGYNVNSNDPIEWEGNEIIPSQYWDSKNREINRLLTNAGHPEVRGASIMNLNRATVESTIQSRQLALSETKNSEEAISKLSELSNKSMSEALGWIRTMNSLQLVNPSTGQIVVFEINEDEPKVSVQSALTLLKALRVDVENDSGDIGSSSKIFMQVGSWIDGGQEKATDLNQVLESNQVISFGTVEILMMIMLLFLSLLCELAINQFAPTVRVSRKMLGQFRHCLPKEFNVNKFMFNLVNELRDYDLIDDKEWHEQIKYCNEKLSAKEEKEVVETAIKVEHDTTFGDEVDSLVSEIEGIIQK